MSTTQLGARRKAGDLDKLFCLIDVLIVSFSQ